MHIAAAEVQNEDGQLFEKLSAPSQPAVQPTKAALARVKKARQAKVGPADGAITVHLTAEELDRGKKSDEEVARQKYLASVSEDASFIASTVKDFAALCQVADKAVVVRDEFFTEKMRVPEFADKIQRVRDWASSKHHGEFLTVGSKQYTSVKVFFQEELGYSYEYIRQQCKKLSRLDTLIEDAQSSNPAPPAPAPAETNVQQTEHKTPPAKCSEEGCKKPPFGSHRPEHNITTNGKCTIHGGAETYIYAPQPEILSINGFDTTLSVPQRVQSAFQSVQICTGKLSTAEKQEFYGAVIDRLQDELDELDEETK
jgi:hypothetical protein